MVNWSCCVEDARPILFVSAAISSAISVKVRGFGFSSNWSPDDRPEKTFVAGSRFGAAFDFLLRMPSRWSVNVPGTLMEILPSRSRKSIPF